MLKMLPEDPGHRHRFERCTNHMRRPRAMRIVRRFGLEQFRMREDDAQLIVQAMKQDLQIVDL